VALAVAHFSRMRTIPSASDLAMRYAAFQKGLSTAYPGVMRPLDLGGERDNITLINAAAVQV
jgi:hypothetical protein